MPSLLITAIRYAHQVWHLKPRQLWARLRARVRRPRLPAATAPVAVKPVPGVWIRPATAPHHRTGDSSFRLLSQEKTVQLPAGWHNRALGKKWLMELNAFHWLPEDASNQAARLVHSWCEHCGSPPAPAWHPYMTSQRICNWLKWHLAGHALPQQAIALLAVQAEFVRQNPCDDELDHKYLNNGKALLFCGCLLNSPRAPAWREQGWRLITRYVPELVADDGGYIGLSTMYHSALLLDLLDIANLLRALEQDVPEFLHAAITRARHWLACLRHPDGTPALFNDAALQVVPEPDALEDYARRLGYGQRRAPAQGLNLLADSGFARLAQNDSVLLVDVGAIGPDHAASHGHADTLSFEMSLHGRQLFVDSGLYSYEEMPTRLQLRATAAHNTATLDGRNSSDVWSNFKGGRRARVHNLRHQGDARCLSISAGHDGFKRLTNPLLHHRQWILQPGRLRLIDTFSGRGRHHIELHFHLHPAIEVLPAGDNRYRLQSADGRLDCELTLPQQVHCRLTGYHYSPTFGHMLPAKKVVVSYRAMLPQELASELCWQISGN